jgi:hypothetical protein
MKNATKSTLSLFSASVLLWCSAVCLGQQGEIAPISTDRPSVGVGPDLVPVRALQIESGTTWSHDRTMNAFDGPESMLRYGLSHRVELQAALSNMHWQQGAPGMQMDDLSFGAKIRLGSESWSWPLGIVGSLSFPTGSKELTSGGMEPSATLATSHNLPRGFQLSDSASLGFISIGGKGRFLNSQLAASVGWCVTAHTCVFVEEAPFFSRVPNSSGYTTDVGLTWRHGLLRQLDWRIGTTVQSDGTTIFTSVGYSARRLH